MLAKFIQESGQEGSVTGFDAGFYFSRYFVIFRCKNYSTITITNNYPTFPCPFSVNNPLKSFFFTPLFFPFRVKQSILLTQLNAPPPSIRKRRQHGVGLNLPNFLRRGACPDRRLLRRVLDRDGEVVDGRDR